ncbi:MAG: hypothetical protein M1378_03725, partial [Bacteroidetes bacterium]|nr:hypothetical protein [Bacteroidota bacterium]
TPFICRSESRDLPHASEILIKHIFRAIPERLPKQSSLAHGLNHYAVENLAQTKEREDVGND